MTQVTITDRLICTRRDFVVWTGAAVGARLIPAIAAGVSE